MQIKSGSCEYIFLSLNLNAMLLYRCTVICWGGFMDIDLQERVMLERVELIARLAKNGICEKRDREIALSLIVEIASNSVLSNKQFSVVLAAVPLNK